MVTLVCYFTPLGLRSIVISLFVRLFVCLSVCPSHNSKTVRPNFTKFFVHVAMATPTAVARSSCDGIADTLTYVLPILRMTSCFHTIGPIGGWAGMALCTCSPVAYFSFIV